ncbi:carboxymuconolactone decarboxylase family protein [Catellatospora methionotrophica]|uniref:carboxymuconolactone decarboxylase family protein n=1 Tax=Catellatospora methionotrophica TaxID=121620 RepID=UPI0034084BEA
MGVLLARVTRGGTMRQVQHVTPVHPAAATGLVTQVYQQMERDFGMLAPPIALHSPAPDSLAAAWSILRESLLSTGHTGRRTREVVAAAVSAANTCPYCVAVHGSTLVGLGGRELAAVGRGRPDEIADAGMRALARWAGGDPAVPAPFPDAHTAELVGVAVTFHYLNRMVNVFLPPSPLPPAVPARARGAVENVTGRIMAALARRTAAPGLSAPLLPAAPLPADLHWASGQPAIAAAFARAAHAVDRAADTVLPGPVRELAEQLAATPDAGPTGLSAAPWLDAAVAPLPAAQRPTGRLLLLTMFASYRVTAPLVAQVRQDTGLDDAGLIRITSWASLLAARAAGDRLSAARPSPDGVA